MAGRLRTWWNDPGEKNGHKIIVTVVGGLLVAVTVWIFSWLTHDDPEARPPANTAFTTTSVALTATSTSNDSTTTAHAGSALGAASVPPITTEVPVTSPPSTTSRSIASPSTTARTGSVPVAVPGADVPGGALALGTPVQSLVDQATKQSDVYSIDLAVGQKATVHLSAPNGVGGLVVYNPGTESIHGTQSVAWSTSVGSTPITHVITSAVATTYYISITGSATSQTYTLSVD